MRTVLGLLVIIVLAVFLGVAFWQSLPGTTSTTGPGGATTVVRLAPDDSRVLEQGRVVYQMHCAVCHGENLEGQPNWRERRADGRLPAPPHDPSGHTWHHPDAELFALTKYGIGPVAGIPDYPSDMPAYQGILSDQEIIAVLSWIKAQWPAEIRARHDAINRQAASR